MKRRLSLCLRYWFKCNNRCSFCFEDNSKFDKLRNGLYRNPSVFAIRNNNTVAKSIIESDDYDFFTFKLMGGELFNVVDKDITKELINTIKWIYSVYKEHNLLETINLNKENSAETLVLASNLMYDDTTSLISCLNVLKEIDYIGASSMFSFDLYGRFNSQKTLEQYHKNILYIDKHYKDVLNIVPSLVLSKQNMNIIAENKNCKELDVFKDLYHRNFSFDIQLLLNDSHINEFAYTEDELNRFLDVLYDKYPRLLQVFRANSIYKKFNTTRKTIQYGEVMQEERLFECSSVKNCLLCDKYKICHHSYSHISYNATKCDVNEFLKKCNF